MKMVRYHTLFLIATIGIAGMLHIGVHNFLFSLFIFPIAIAALLPYLRISSLTTILLIIGGFELFSTFPPGIMTLTAVLPFLVHRIFSNIHVGLSGAFFILATATVGILFLFLATTQLILTLPQDTSLSDIMLTVPLPLLFSWLPTSVLVFSLAIIWNEVVLPPSPLKTPLLK